MKLIKYIILFVIVSLGFVFQTEVFQSQLYNFSGANYLQSTFEVYKNEREDFVKELSKIAEEKKVLVFSVEIDMENNYKNIVKIYGNTSKIKNELRKKDDITERKYNSLISGISKIEYHNFDEIINNDNVKNVSFIGEKENVLDVYRNIKEKYLISRPMITQSTERDAVTIVWVLIILVLIIINMVEVFLRKKEIVLRISLGENEKKIVLKSIFSEIIINTCIFFVAKTLVFQFVSGDYESKYVFFLYMIGNIFASLIYISYGFFDIRKAYANINDNPMLLYFCYLLKIVVFVIALFAIMTNLETILKIDFLKTSLNKKLSGNYYYLSTICKNDYNEEDERKIWDCIYDEEYNTLKPNICVNLLEDKNDYIFVNENARFMLGKLNDIKYDKNSDIVVFMPSDAYKDEYKKGAVSILERFIKNDINNLKISGVKYDDKLYFEYLKSTETSDIKTSKNPIIIFKNSSNVNINGYELVNYAGNSILYNTDEEIINKIIENKGFGNNKYLFVITKYEDYHKYKESFLKKLFSLLSSFCILIIFLDILTVLAVNKLMFRNNMIEISLKKIFGYSLFERHKQIFILQIFVEVILAILMIIINLFMNFVSSIVVVLIGVILISLEVIIMVNNIISIENKNINKVLKGGCL